MALRAKSFRHFTAFGASAAQLLERSAPTSDGGRVFKGVTLIRSGIGNKRDKNYYPPEVLQKAVDDGLFEGLRAYVDHQDTVSEEIHPERTLRDFAGIYRNARWDSNLKEVRADLRVFKSFSWLSDTISELIREGMGDRIGLSINGRGETKPERMRLEEAGEEVEVNRLERFVALKSTDFVTEAGAGGGFGQLLESCRGASRTRKRTTKENQTMNRKELIAQLQEAAAAGDTSKVTELTARLASLEETGEAKPLKYKGKAKKVMVEDDEDDDLAEADEAGEADEDDEDDEGNDELEEALDEITDDADAALDEDDDLAEADEDDEDDSGSCGCRKNAREATVSGMTGPGGNVSGPTGRMTTPDKGPKRSSKINPGKTMRHRRVTPGARTIEAQLEDMRQEIALLKGRNNKLSSRNDRLAEALRVRAKADTARKILEESGIPSDLRADLLRRLVEMPSEDAMRREVRFTQRLMESASTSAWDRSEVEHGSRVRESFGGQGGDDDFSSELRELGLPVVDEN